MTKPTQKRRKEETYGQLLQAHYFKYLFNQVEIKMELKTVAYLWSLEHLGARLYYYVAHN